MAGRRSEGSSDDNEFEVLLDEAIRELPAEFRERLDNVAILLEGYPSAELLEREEVPEDQTLFGYYEGIPLTERTSEAPLYPDRILIFQHAIEDACNSPDEIKEELRITLLHEIAHFFGMEEDEVEDAGYG